MSEKNINTDVEEGISIEKATEKNNEETVAENSNEKPGGDSKKEAENTVEETDTIEGENLGSDNEAKEEDSASYVRLMADFQNYKRRVEKEKSDIHAYANEKIISKLLDVTDNFERALVHTPEEESKFHEGMEMILEQLKGVMTEAGVEEIEALGQPFDPNFHNAVMMEDLGEEKKDTIIAVLQKGYTLKGRVLRPSMVKVGQ